MTTNITGWLDANEPDTNEEAYCLHRASHGEGMGPYTTVRTNGQLRVEGSAGWLILVSAKAEAFFRCQVDLLMPDRELGWEGGYAFQRAMAKDD